MIGQHGYVQMSLDASVLVVIHGSHSQVAFHGTKRILHVGQGGVQGPDFFGGKGHAGCPQKIASAEAFLQHGLIYLPGYVRSPIRLFVAFYFDFVEMGDSFVFLPQSAQPQQDLFVGLDAFGFEQGCADLFQPAFKVLLEPVFLLPL